MTAIEKRASLVEDLGICANTRPEDARPLEVRRHQNSEILRIGGVPLHLIRFLSRATFTRAEPPAAPANPET